MTQDFDTIPEGATIEQIRSILESSSHGDFFVVGRDGELVGTITFADIKAVAFDPTLNQLVNARDIARLHPAVLRPGDDLENALKVMDGSGEGSLPVVEDDQTMRVLGIVQHRDALVAYNRALMQAREEEHDEGHRYRRR
jgi:CIC family chloride channel protein